MKKQSKSKLFKVLTVLAAILIAAVPAMVLADGEAAEEVSKMFGTLWSLVPPVIAIVLALITKEVYSSLFVGIVIGGLFAADFSPIATVDNVVNEGIIGAVSGLAGIFIFLVILGILVALVNKAGGSYAFGEWAKKNIKSRVGASLATFLLGVIIFIDDYFNCLTVGSVMRPVTDAHKISRAKLAYLIDATAAPICMIAPISSWAAAKTVADGTAKPVEQPGGAYEKAEKINVEDSIVRFDVPAFAADRQIRDLAQSRISFGFIFSKSGIFGSA